MTTITIYIIHYYIEVIYFRYITSLPLLKNDLYSKYGYKTYLLIEITIFLQPSPIL